MEGASGVLAGGLFNLELSGSGWVALLSDGPPMLLQLKDDPAFADPQAAITWSSGVKTSVKTDMNLKTLIGRGSGETLQMEFSGDGWLLVQPSEGRVDVGSAPRPAAAGSATCSAASACQHPGVTPRVEFLWWEGCPSHERALADLRAAMADAGLDPAGRRGRGTSVTRRRPRASDSSAPRRSASTGTTSRRLTTSRLG